MKASHASVVQILGSVILVLGLGAWSVPVAAVVAGVMTIVFGVAAERD